MFLVSHEEGDTDTLQAFAEDTAHILGPAYVGILDYAVKVDVPECFVLDGSNAAKSVVDNAYDSDDALDMEGDRANDAVFEEAFRADPAFEREYGDLYRVLEGDPWRVRTRAEVRESPGHWTTAEPGSRVDAGLPAYNRESYFR
jgi:hypothetical protein